MSTDISKYITNKSAYQALKNTTAGDEEEEYVFINGDEKDLTPPIMIDEDGEMSDINDINTQIGGGGPFFKNNTILYILAKPTNPALIRAYDDRIKILLDDKMKSSKAPHITLFAMHINQDHPNADEFQSQGFKNEIRRLYDIHFANVNIESKYGSYRMFGTKKLFFVRKYDIIGAGANVITDFRMGIYDYIKSNFGVANNQYRKENKNQETYIVNSYNGIDLFAIDQHNSGRGNWQPHISIIDSSDIDKLKVRHPSSYHRLYGNVNFERKTPTDKASHLTDLIHWYGNPQNNPTLNKKIQKMTDINMAADMAELTFSMRNARSNPKINIEENI